MLQLRRVRLESIGHPNARFAPLELNLTDEEDRPTHTVVWLRNGGGKSSLLNALLGSANLILKEVELHDPRAVVLCFGPDAASYRTELYPAYHAEREAAMPDDLAPQFAACRNFFEAFGWTVATSDDLDLKKPAITQSIHRTNLPSPIHAKAGFHARSLMGRTADIIFAPYRWPLSPRAAVFMSTTSPVGHT